MDKEMKNTNIYILLLMIFSGISLSSCGGGGGSNDILSQNDTSSVVEGVLIDSAIEGVYFESETQSGTTDSNGKFTFKQGEVVDFYIGDVLLGSALGDDLITPINFVSGAVDETDPQVTNILRFVQALDDDSNPDNGIFVSNNTRNALKDQVLDFSLNEADFESAFNGLSSAVLGNISLVSVSDARAHFVDSVDFLSGDQIISGVRSCRVSYLYDDTIYSQICFKNFPVTESCENSGLLETDLTGVDSNISITYQLSNSCSDTDSIFDASLLGDVESGTYGRVFLFGDDMTTVGTSFAPESADSVDVVINGETVTAGLTWSGQNGFDSDSAVGTLNVTEELISLRFAVFDDETFQSHLYVYSLDCNESDTNIIEFNSDCHFYSINNLNKRVMFNGVTLQVHPFDSEASIVNQATAPITLQGTLKW